MVLYALSAQALCPALIGTDYNYSPRSGILHFSNMRRVASWHAPYQYLITEKYLNVSLFVTGTQQGNIVCAHVVHVIRVKYATIEKLS